MSEDFDWSLIEPTILLSEVAFMDNAGYQFLKKGMTKESLEKLLREHIDFYNGEDDVKLREYVSQNFTIVDFIDKHDTNGINAILFHRESDNRYFLAVDGMHTKHWDEWPADLLTVSLYPGEFEDPGTPGHQLTDLVNFVREADLPEGARLIFTGQSLGSTNAIAATMLLGDMVEWTIPHNGPNLIGWATLSDGNLLKISASPRWAPSGITHRDLAAGGDAFVPLRVEIVLSNVDTSKVVQFTNIGDPFAGRVILDEAITQGISLGKTIQLDTDRYEGLDFRELHDLNAARGLVERPKYFSNEYGFTDNVDVDTKTGDDLLKLAIESGRVVDIKFSTLSKELWYEDLATIYSVHWPTKESSDVLEGFLIKYSDGRIQFPANVHDRQGIRQIIDRSLLDIKEHRILELNHSEGSLGDERPRTDEGWSAFRRKRAQERLEATYPTWSWSFDWASDEEVTISKWGKKFKSITLSYDSFWGRFYPVDPDIQGDLSEAVNERGHASDELGQGLRRPRTAEELERLAYEKARAEVEAAYPNWSFDWISDEEVVVGVAPV